MPVISTPTVFADEAASRFNNPVGRDKITFQGDAYVLSSTWVNQVGSGYGLYLRPIAKGASDVYVDRIYATSSTGRTLRLFVSIALQTSPIPSITVRTVNFNQSDGPQWGYLGDPGLGAGVYNLAVGYASTNQPWVIDLPNPILMAENYYLGVNAQGQTGTFTVTMNLRIVR